MNKLIENTTVKELEKQGFAHTGFTTDETMLAEIKRDYARNGYETRFTSYGSCKVHYWIKPNVQLKTTATPDNRFPL